jgi:hypothetical protein
MTEGESGETGRESNGEAAAFGGRMNRIVEGLTGWREIGVEVGLVWEAGRVQSRHLNFCF